MSTVYLATDLKLHRPVAVKVLRPELTAVLGTERFLREIEIAARLSHPHILPLHDSGEVDGILFFVMPYVEGESLRQRLDRERRLPVDVAVLLAAQVATALDYAHQQGIVHRDIKPENILLHSGQAIVADFGIARAIDAAATDAPSRAALTGTGVVLGTPLYMSPEQVTGDPVDGRTDVYALGCVLYEMLAGASPFSGPTAQAVLARHAIAPVPSLRKIRPEIPAAIDRAVATALAKSPADRFPSAAAFHDVLTGAAPAPRSDASRLVLRRAAYVAAIVAMLALAATWVASRRSHPAEPPTIAVMPFVNQSGNPDDEYFASGITEELVNGLGQVPGLRVQSRRSALALGDSRLDSKAIGARLNASMLLEGSVLRAGSTMRVTAQLINAATGVVQWSNEYRKDVKDVIEVEDDISHAIVGALQLRLAGDDRPLVQRSTDNPEAYDLYLKGRYFWNQRESGPGAMQRAIGFFQQAIALDSNFARAWAGLADAYSFLPGFASEPPGDAFAKAKAAAQRALALDSNLAEVHRSLGVIAVFHDWDWPTAAHELERALALDSTDASAHLFYAWYDRCMGRLDEALAESKTARRLDPLNQTFNARVGTMLMQMRRYREAEAALKQAIELDPSNVAARSHLGEVLALDGKFQEALAVVPIDTTDSHAYPVTASAGYVYGIAGRRAEALAMQRRLERHARERYITPEALAMVAMGLRDTTAALDWLDRGYRERSFFIWFAAGEPSFDPLRGSPRFERLVRGIGCVELPIHPPR